MKTVLVIEGDEPFRKLMARWLTLAGWEVIEARDGETGVQFALQYQPLAIVCDLLMPRCNGFQVCRAVREKGIAIRQPRIIVTTGSGYPADEQNALEVGADHCLIKPFKADELVRCLDGVLPGQTTVTPRPAAPVTVEMSPMLPLDQPPYVKFWGVRGSIPTPGAATMQYGGNTTCVEVRADGEHIILDAGTGIRPLGLDLAREFKGSPIRSTLLITHTHWDHIQGFPFFIPAYNPLNQIRVLGYEGARNGLVSTLTHSMESPYFPVSLSQMPGNISVEELKSMEFSIGRVKVEAAFVNHPGVTVGYRLRTSGGSIAFLPDNEPFQRMRSQTGSKNAASRNEALKFASDQDDKLIEFIRDADVLIMDAQYDDSEYQTRAGWGHGCVDDVVALAMFAKVKHLFLFHHDPDHDDAQISRMQAWARRLVAMQGESLDVDAAIEGVEYYLTNAQAAACPVPA